MKIRKEFNLRIITFVVLTAFLFTNLAYSEGLSKQDRLRVSPQMSSKIGKKRWKKFLTSNKVLKTVFFAEIAMILLAGAMIWKHINTKDRIKYNAERSLGEIDKELDLLTDVYARLLGIDTIDEKNDVLSIKPGDMTLVLASHGSAKGFVEASILLDKIFDKAKLEKRKVVCYIESGPPNTIEEINDAFPELDIRRALENPEYKDEFLKMITERHKNLAEEASQITSGEFLLNGDILKHEDLETLENGHQTFRKFYLSLKACGDFDLSIIYEKSKLETYLLGLDQAASEDEGKDITYFEYNKYDKAREKDFIDIISATSDSSAYNVILIGAHHVDLRYMLIEKGYSVAPFVSKGAIYNLREIINSRKRSSTETKLFL
ncbi:hypothetical protein ACFL2G_04360 [Candidatus Omnitrophota bacterium]